MTKLRTENLHNSLVLVLFCHCDITLITDQFLGKYQVVLVLVRLVYLFDSQFEVRASNGNIVIDRTKALNAFFQGKYTTSSGNLKPIFMQRKSYTKKHGSATFPRLRTKELKGGS